jgi:ribosome maturation factor RimP
MSLKENITQLIENNFLENGKFFIVDINTGQGRLSTKISVLIDSDEGIGIDECATISRKLGNLLEELDLIPNSYILEVSSPGIEQPLKLHRQYIKNIGREVKVLIVGGQEQKGKLTDVKIDYITIELPIKKSKSSKKITEEASPYIEIPFEQIEKTQVLVSFK